MNSESVFYLALSLIKGIGLKTAENLINYLGSAERVFNCSKKTINDLDFIPENIKENLITQRYDINPDKIIENLRSRGIGFFAFHGDPKYPETLKHIYNPPMILYYKGNIDLLNNKKIAIVGSRKCSQYGRIVAENLSKDLANHNITIVSGLAGGIDSFAHKGSLNGPGSTIGVLGCGFNYVYPKENRALFREISQKGLLLTEYPPDTPPIAFHFPARNRIISGISQGILVVEAGEKSGALITVSLGLDQGKDIYVVPGQINSPYSKGTNNLLKLGAIPVTSASDILNECGVAFERTPMNLTDMEREVLLAINPEGTYKEDLLIRFNNGDLDLILLQLEIKDYIKRLPGDTYVLK